ncbi:MAG: mechanosensitive ion channel family protein [Clostridia bacterium]|nr:mechanosensitive ion channel family protein [Clostridia bacterium]
MKFINETIEMLKQITFEQIIDLWVGLAIIIIFKILSSSFAYIIVKMFKFKVKDKKIIKQNAFYKPLRTFFVLLGVYIATMSLNLPENIFAIVTKIFKICVILLSTIGFANLFNSNSETFSKIREKLHFNGTDTTINFFSKIAKALIYIVGAFIVISELGYDLSGLVAGLGIGTAVIALAAQDVAKSMLAGFSIISDRPFDIGDYIEVDIYKGTVEDITFRTTRIRDINNQIVVLPNSLLTTTSIINGTKREKRRYELLLTLELNTSLDKVSELTENIKLTLNTHENIEKESIRVFFDTISANGIDISIGFYTDLIDLVDFLKFKEEMNYKLLEMIKNANIELAYPSQSIYLKKD